MNTPISVFVALSVLGWAATPQAMPSFLEIDKDKDGFISPTESIAVPGLSEQMTVLDTNSGGLLSPIEFSRMNTPPVQKGIPMDQDISSPLESLRLIIVNERVGRSVQGSEPRVNV